MIDLPLAYTLALFGAFSVYVLLGFHVLSVNARHPLNRLFILLCGSLAVWSLALSLGNQAPDAETALIWRRVSAVGWTTLFAFLVHFALVLTERRKLLAHAATYVALYLPAAAALVVFALDGDLAARHSTMTMAATGWVTVPSPTLANAAFLVYYVTSVVVSVVAIGQWGARSSDPQRRSLVRMLRATFLFALVLGSVSDRLANAFLSSMTPQLAPLAVLLSVAAFIIAIRRFGLMAAPPMRRSAEQGKILSEANRALFYRHLSLAFVVGSILNPLHYFFFATNLAGVLWFSAALFAIGLVLLLTPQLPIRQGMQDTVMMGVVALSIPLIVFRFADAYASNIVWPIPLIFLAVSAIFERPRMLWVLATSAIVTQVAMWSRVPQLTVDVGPIDHASRLVLYGLAVVLAYYVNRVYLQRLADNEEHVRLQRTLSQISAEFVSVSEANLPQKLATLLAWTGEACRADRAFLFTFDRDGGALSYAEEWRRSGVTPGHPIGSVLLATRSPWWLTRFEGDDLIHVTDVVRDVDAGPTEGAATPSPIPNGRAPEPQRTRSLLVLRLASRDRVLGFLGLETVRGTADWREEHRDLLRVLANLTSDAMTQVESEREIQRMAYFDAVTGLPNRTLFATRLEDAIEKSSGSGTHIGVALIDLDGFKSVNDTVGHAGGDTLLRQVAARLSSRVRKSDTVSRFGGDEFLLLVPHLERPEAMRSVADHLMKAFRDPVTIDGQEFFVTASAGVAIYPDDGEDAAALVKNADLAMYAAKALGKNRFATCTPAMKDDVEQRTRLIQALYRAQERGEFTLDYQPQLNLATSRIVGVEALLRWHHPEFGKIAPSTFVPLLEQTGLIGSVGEWVLRTACRQSVAWRDEGHPPMRMAVNLSVQQVRSPGVVDVVERALRDTGIAPGSLELEITESMAFKESGDVLATLDALKALGVTISIDDFGTEYSSLERLAQMPIDRVKMAMQFVQGIGDNSRQEAIVNVIIDLARNLGLKVMAEGVETDAQLAYLESRQCDEAQGYRFYRPMSAEEVGRRIALVA